MVVKLAIHSLGWTTDGSGAQTPPLSGPARANCTVTEQGSQLGRHVLFIFWGFIPYSLGIIYYHLATPCTPHTMQGACNYNPTAQSVQVNLHGALCSIASSWCRMWHCAIRIPPCNLCKYICMSHCAVLLVAGTECGTVQLQSHPAICASISACRIVQYC